MAFPEYVTTRTVTAGAAATVESSDPLRITVVVSASKDLTWQANGYPFKKVARTISGELGAEVSFALPVTDQSGWIDAGTGSVLDVSAAGSYTHTYVAKVTYADESGRVVSSQTYGPFVLPTDSTPYDLDLGVVVGSTAAAQVTVPDTWSQAVLAAQEAAEDAADALVDSDEFIATQISTSGTATETALSAAIAEATAGLGLGFLGQVFVGFNQITYGHSFLAEQGLSDVSGHWARRFASAFGLTYPTSAGGAANDLKRAVGGSEVAASAVRVLNTAPYVPGPRQLVVIENLINSARLHGDVAIDKTSALNHMRAILVALNAASVIQESDPAVSYSETFTTAAVSTAMGGSTRATSVAGAYFQFTAPTDDAYVLTVGRGAGTAGAVISVTDQTTGTTIATIDTSDQSLTSSGAYAWRIPESARGHVVRFTRVSGTSMYLDAIVTQSATPPPVLWMKEPHLGDYSYSTSFPNGSDAALDAFNALVDVVASEFINVIVADPQRAGYWTKAKALPGVDGALVQTDGVHPSALGGLALFNTARDALLAYMTRRAIQVNLAVQTSPEPEPEPFDLLTDPDLVAFYDSDTLSALADGATVATWAPAAGIETVALARSTTAERPIMSTGAVYAGKRALLFDGVDDDMAGTFAGTYSGPVTLLVVGQIQNADDCIAMLSGSGVATAILADTDGTLKATAASGGTLNAASFAPSTTYRKLGVVANGGSSGIYVDGAKTSGALATSTGGNVLRLGETATATRRLLGAVVSLAYFRRALTDAEVAEAFTQMLS